MDFNKIIEELKVDEGFKPSAYQDHLGFWTIGYGRLVDERRGAGLSQHEATILLENDVQRVIGALDYRIPWWKELPVVKQEALVNMAFQLGVAGLLNFKRMLDALEKKDYTEASAQALDSKWAKQTPQRAQRIATKLGA